MDYMILDSTGNAVYSSQDETETRATLRAIVKLEPEAADHLVLLAYDEEGRPVGEALTVADLPPEARVEASEFLMEPLTAALVQRVYREANRYVATSAWAPTIQPERPVGPAV